MIKTGDRVVYAKDPVLYGVLVVVWMRRDGRVECVTVREHEDGRALERERGQRLVWRGEVFDRRELTLVSEFVKEAVA